MATYAFYGTLQSGQRLSRSLARLGHYGPDVVLDGADLFSVGAFPALVPGSGSVRAQLWHANPDREAEAMAMLDRIEGYRPTDPEGSLYVRRSCQLADGSSAYVYVWNRPTHDLVPIPSGDWLRWADDARTVAS